MEKTFLEDDLIIYRKMIDFVFNKDCLKLDMPLYVGLSKPPPNHPDRRAFYNTSDSIGCNLVQIFREDFEGDNLQMQVSDKDFSVNLDNYFSNGRINRSEVLNFSHEIGHVLCHKDFKNNEAYEHLYGNECYRNQNDKVNILREEKQSWALGYALIQKVDSAFIDKMSFDKYASKNLENYEKENVR